MQIITISKGSQCYGEEFARNLADKLDYLCIGREEILEEATRQRIPIGKLETAIIKPNIFSEELALELEHYKALATHFLCEKALDHNIVYHGRTGHFLLQGIENILKIRVNADLESRIEMVMQNLSLSRIKAKQFIEQTDQDIQKWIKKFYNMDWDLFTNYDLVLNLSQINVGNAASAICAMAQLPDFQATPSTVNTLQDLYLASKARLMLFNDQKTSHMNIKVRAGSGIVYVTYLSQKVKEAEMISEVLTQLDDAKEIICTEAETSILWIQETFSPDDGSYNDVKNLAGTWGAAVELIQVSPSDTSEQLTPVEEKQIRGTESWRETGIMDDKQDEDTQDSNGISKIYEKLINDGSAGEKRIIQGSQKTLLKAINRTTQYRLIILDNIFTSKGHETQTRLLREWSNFIGENLKIPVLSLKEIHSKYKFGFKELIKMLLFSLMTVFIVFMIFEYDTEILTFLTQEGFKWKILATISVFIFIPFYAYIYSTVTRLFFKMIKLD